MSISKYKDNVLGSIFMTISTSAFIFNDTLIKYTVSDVNIYQTIFIRGIESALQIFISICPKFDEAAV